MKKNMYSKKWLFFILFFGLQDSSISSALVVVDLVDAIKPGTINYDLLRDTGMFIYRYQCILDPHIVYMMWQ